LGLVAFETRVNKQGYQAGYALLNEPQSMFLLTLMRNIVTLTQVGYALCIDEEG
jgi:hypothetical protein